MTDLNEAKENAIVEMLEVEFEALNLIHRLGDAIEALTNVHTEEEAKAWEDTYDEFDEGLERIRVFI